MTSYEVRDTGNRGLGIFALEDIPAGARMLDESPLIIILSGKGMRSNITRFFFELSSENKTTFLSLCHRNLEDESNTSDDSNNNASNNNANAAKIINIFETNALGIETGTTEPFRLAALCPQASRLNHSCTPNVFCAFTETTENHTVHAIRAIRAGEELCNSYINGSYLTTSKRQSELAKWAFRCACPACDGDVRMSDERRARLAHLQSVAQEPREHMRRGDLTPQLAREFVGVLEEMVEIMETEGLVGGEMADICGAAGYLSVLSTFGPTGCFDMAKRNRGLAFMRQKVQVLRRCYGGDNPVVEKAEANFERLAAEFLLVPVCGGL
ncbi:hypothetical protein BDV97DRAFT_389105 [Delphinella strobiligena]|nr:hypothetical protein BDV97DRAFT_389105 [Delphinella strobiligena]